MKLDAAQVQNYRSIVNSGIVDIDDKVTVIIGKNGQGKTNFLRALVSFNPKNTYTPSDLPNHLRASLEDKEKSVIPIISLWLTPSETDRQSLRGVVSSIEEIKQFKITRFYDGYYSYRAINIQGTENDVAFGKPDTSEVVKLIKDEADLLKIKFAAHAKRYIMFAIVKQQADNHIDQLIASDFEDKETSENLIKTFFTALKGLPAQDAAIQSDVATTAKKIETLKTKLFEVFDSDLSLELEKLFPQFVFHSATLDKIPNDVSIPEFTKNPDEYSKGMSNICKAAGLSIQKIQELAATEPHKREVYEDQYRTSISGGINEFWTQETYEIHFRIDKDKLSVSISDSTYDRRIPPSDRSDGFQWYLSFYSALLSEVSATESMVVLLDNPALELHADGQRDIKRFLQEKLSTTAQIIYVTHSPAMLDTFKLEQVRKVELSREMKGTKISNLTIKEDQLDLLEPVRSTIGASLVDTLMTNEFNVLVEGATDKPILEGALQLLLPKEANKIVINGSLSESGLLLPRFYEKTRLPFLIFLDADSGGRELKKNLITNNIPKEKIVYLGDVIEKEGDFELEDLFSSKLYFNGVKKTYPELKLKEIKDEKGKRTKSYETLFKDTQSIGFCKRRVGETLKRLLIENKGDKETKKNLNLVVDKIWTTLQGQIKGS